MATRGEPQPCAKGRRPNPKRTTTHKKMFYFCFFFKLKLWTSCKSPLHTLFFSRPLKVQLQPPAESLPSPPVLGSCPSLRLFCFQVSTAPPGLYPLIFIVTCPHPNQKLLEVTNQASGTHLGFIIDLSEECHPKSLWHLGKLCTGPYAKHFLLKYFIQFS